MILERFLDLPPDAVVPSPSEASRDSDYLRRNPEYAEYLESIRPFNRSPVSLSEVPMAAPKACKFAPGDKVSHPAAADGSFPAGTGTVESCTACPAHGFDVIVRCDATGELLPAFKDCDLKAAP